MYYKTTACPASGEPASTCTVRAMYPPRGNPPRRRCCTSCAHDERKVERPEPPQLPPHDGPGIPMSAAEVDDIVAAVLRQAETLGDGQVEEFGRATVNAYRSLARSRGPRARSLHRLGGMDRLRNDRRGDTGFLYKAGVTWANVASPGPHHRRRAQRTGRLL